MEGRSDDAIPNIVTLEQMSKVKQAWERARDSVRAALGILTSEPAPGVASIHPRSRFKLWVKNLSAFCDAFFIRPLMGFIK
jgi:hypothetical protein